MKKSPKENRKLNRRYRSENIQLWILIMPITILLLLFDYWPMFGIVIAFKSYKVTKGIFGSPLVDPWYKNFEFFIKSDTAWRVTRNTLVLNFMMIILGVVFAVIFALIMFEVKKGYQVKVYQTFSILPSFLSWVAISYIVYALLDMDKGAVNSFLNLFGIEAISWYAKADYWPAILIIVKLWQSTGLASIIYYAALMGIDNELFEAAEMDGANRFKQIIHISLPQLVPIITMMTILNIGTIFRSDFGLFYNVTRNTSILYPTTDVLDTYVYRALTETGNIGMSSAAAFIQSIVCFVVVMIVNTIVRKVKPDYALF